MMKSMPTNIAGLRINGVLGEGVLGTIYDGVLPGVERRVTIKTINKSALEPGEVVGLLGRFRREVETVSRLHHPNIVVPHAWGETDEFAYVAMEHVQGKALQEHFEAGERFALENTVRIMCDVLVALDHAHRNGVVHGGLRPGNILVTEDDRVRVTDFGIAGIESSITARQSTLLATHTHVSPEQRQGLSADRRSDIYSSGAVLYQFLTGKCPLSDDVSMIDPRIRTAEAMPTSEINVTIPRALDMVVNKAIAKQVEDRYQSANEFAEALIEAASGCIAQVDDNINFLRGEALDTDPFEHARHEAEERSRRAAEGKVRYESEGKAKREAEERSRREAEERARREFTDRHLPDANWWIEVKDSVNAEDLRQFMETFPQSRFVPLAMRRLAKLQANGDSDRIGQIQAIGASHPALLDPGSGHATTAASASKTNGRDGIAVRYDDSVQFTVYRPNVVVPDRWYPLLAFAHLEERRPDAAPQDLDPLAEVRRQAARVLGADVERFKPVTSDSTEGIPVEGDITFRPEIHGIEFNPPHVTFRWSESVHRHEFRLRAARSLDGRVARGRLTVLSGIRIVADVILAIRVDSRVELSKEQCSLEATTGRRYRKVFASYSRRDAVVVEQFERYLGTVGDQYLRDVTSLRTGEVWDKQIERMIQEADIFQLFWSNNAMRSQQVRQEWEHALRLERENFVRPVYWEEPFPRDETSDLPPEPLRRLHFYKLAPVESERSDRSNDSDVLSCVLGPVERQSNQDLAQPVFSRRDHSAAIDREWLRSWTIVATIAAILVLVFSVVVFI